MTARILVTGGTGTLGRQVVPLLRGAGHPVRVLSRHAGPVADGVDYVACDLLDGTGVDDAVDGVETVLHLAGGPRHCFPDHVRSQMMRAARVTVPR
ncbi:SDR family oxidoreductase [Streptomyces sp. NPDC056670]|uniref:SDR family oxidoreductase n=1 Tax=Streptomyces sp. NPDC056670 TaxID=3345904 RepID=UPI003697699C